MTAQTTIGSFRKEWRWLSNFYETKIIYEGKTYPTVEHAYQAAKTRDENEREIIRNLKTPGEAKKYARKLPLRKDWVYVRLTIMKELLSQKFAKGTSLAKSLKKTKEMELIEFNSWHDNYWGWCICNECKNKTKFNRLGYLLTQVREDLKTK